jgi:ABC-2 type transport system ATP-binding protein
MADDDVIRVEHLSKRFEVPLRKPRTSLWRRVAHFVRNPTESLTAVNDLSFRVARGEVIGLLGANGSGKSTTVKMLTGILTPSSGEATVLGFSPHRQRKAYTQHIGVVFGQKSLLWWNIPVIESFKLYRDIYGQDHASFSARLQHFIDVLEIRDYLHIPVRKLSLGMRMRAELVASLLHRPEIIFLDEPTIGLDVLGRRNLKRFLRRLNQDEGVTIVLTTHNMFDVEELCRRCIILREGVKVYDGDIAALKAAERHKILELDVVEILDPDRFQAVLHRCEVLERNDVHYRLRVPSKAAVQVVQTLLDCARLESVNILPPNLEHVVERILEGGIEGGLEAGTSGREDALCGVAR